MIKYIPLILLGVLLNAAAQLFLKKGMIGIGHFAFAAENAVRVTLAAASNPFIVAGLGCYVVSVVLWMLALSRVEVSFAYPFLSVGYVITAVVGYLAFHENLSASRILGILLICIGVTLIARSGGPISS
jgi:multidrug transporter EmrE-like cation transporter